MKIAKYTLIFTIASFSVINLALAGFEQFSLSLIPSLFVLSTTFLFLWKE